MTNEKLIFDQDLFDFIKEREPNLFTIASYRNINTGPEDTTTVDIEVSCVVKIPNPISPIFNLDDYQQRTCIVNSKAFETWRQNKYAIKWK